MTHCPSRITPTIARRLAPTKQRLAGPRPAPGPEGLLEVARDLGCVQLDPIRAQGSSTWPAEWYIHTDDLSQREQLDDSACWPAEKKHFWHDC